MLSKIQIAAKERELEEIRKVYTKILEDKDCLCLKDLAVCGKDLIEQGMKPGKELGETLQKLFEYVLENPKKNNRENLIEYLNVIKKNTL